MYRSLDLTTTEDEMEWLELVFSQELYPVADQHTRRLSRNSACVYTHVSFTRVDQKIETRHEVLRLKVKLSEIFYTLPLFYLRT